MNREVHVRFWERAEVKFLRATRQNENPPFLSSCQRAAGRARARSVSRGGSHQLEQIPLEFSHNRHA